MLWPIHIIARTLLACRRHGWNRRLRGMATAALVSAVAATAAASPAAAAQHSPPAISASHPPGYQIVSSGALNAAPGTFDSGGSAACPAGTVVWGGGVAFMGISSLQLTVNTSEPVGSGLWEARVNNTGTTTAQFVVHAICAHRPKGYKLVSRTVDNPPDTQSHVTATCPSPKVLLGGGTMSTSDQVPAVLTSAWPKGPATFTGYMDNGTSTDERFTVLAICAHKPAGYERASNGVDLEPGTLVDGIACPAGTSALSGGAQDPDHVSLVQVSGSIDQGAFGWGIDVNNNDQSAREVFGYAICAA